MKKQTTSIRLLLNIWLLFFVCFRLLQKLRTRFSCFIYNYQDGLHLTYSRDGLSWASMNNGKSYLTPAGGKDKLMRDPFIIQEKDRVFHMVWNTRWKDRQIVLKIT